jgi:hypothetical protein
VTEHESVLVTPWGIRDLFSILEFSYDARQEIMANFEGLSDSGGMHGDNVNDGLLYIKSFYSRLNDGIEGILPGG